LLAFCFQWHRLQPVRRVDQSKRQPPKTDPADDRHDFAVPKSIQETQSLPTKLSPLNVSLTKVLILNDFLGF
jgi:hypothetical protein